MATLPFAVSDYLNRDGTPRDGAPMGMLLSAYAASRGSATALVLGEQELTFAELDATANQMARLLAGLGVGKGDTVMICMPNRAEFIQAFYGAWKLGAVPCPVSYRLVASELAEIVGLVRPRCVVGDGSIRFATPNFLNVDEVSSDGELAEPLPAAIAEPGKIIASGGSTGRPKLTIDPVPRIGQVHRAALALAGAIDTPRDLGPQIVERHALSQHVVNAAVDRHPVIVVGQRRRHRRGDDLLPAVTVIRHHQPPAQDHLAAALVVRFQQRRSPVYLQLRNTVRGKTTRHLIASARKSG